MAAEERTINTESNLGVYTLAALSHGKEGTRPISAESKSDFQPGFRALGALPPPLLAFSLAVVVASLLLPLLPSAADVTSFAPASAAAADVATSQPPLHPPCVASLLPMKSSSLLPMPPPSLPDSPLLPSTLYQRSSCRQRCHPRCHPRCRHDPRCRHPHHLPSTSTIGVLHVLPPQRLWAVAGAAGSAATQHAAATNPQTPLLCSPTCYPCSHFVDYERVRVSLVSGVTRGDVINRV